MARSGLADSDIGVMLPRCFCRRLHGEESSVKVRFVIGAPPSRIRIGELARRVGATPRAVRYYEELGLLPDSGRSHGAHRLYDESDDQRVRDILRIREVLGLSLTELREWMDAEDARARLRER